MAGHPGQGLEGRGIAHGHVVRAMRAHAETPQRKPGKARAIAQHHVQMFHRHGLRLGGAVDVDELRQHIADVGGAQSREWCRPSSSMLSGVRKTVGQIGAETGIAPQAQCRRAVGGGLGDEHHADAREQRHDDAGRARRSSAAKSKAHSRDSRRNRSSPCSTTLKSQRGAGVPACRAWPQRGHREPCGCLPVRQELRVAQPQDAQRCLPAAVHARRTRSALQARECPCLRAMPADPGPLMPVRERHRTGCRFMPGSATF